MITDSPVMTVTAVTRHRYGGTEQLAVEQVPAPTCGPDQVIVDVRAAGLDRGAWHLMAGEPYVARLAFGLRRPRQPVLGSEFAGVVVEVGTGVTAWKPGDEVFGGAYGSFAQQVAAKAGSIARTPSSLTFEQAAVLPISGTTALQALRDIARVQPGQRVLVIGASGGVGTFAVQIAASMGASVTAVCSAAKADAVRALGATTVLDHRTQRIGDAGPHDVILDIAGGRSIRELRAALTPRGTLVLIGEEGGGKVFGLGRQLRAVLLSPFVHQRLRMQVATVNGTALEALSAMVEDGSVRPVLHATRRLDEVPAAIDDMTAGRITGKVAIDVT